MAKQGRPRRFTRKQERKIGSLIRKHGLTGTQEMLATKGVQFEKGKRAQKVTVSVPTLGNIAQREQIALARGRRAA